MLRFIFLLTFFTNLFCLNLVACWGGVNWPHLHRDPSPEDIVTSEWAHLQHGLKLENNLIFRSRYPMPAFYYQEKTKDIHADFLKLRKQELIVPKLSCQEKIEEGCARCFGFLGDFFNGEIDSSKARRHCLRVVTAALDELKKKQVVASDEMKRD